jgi:hypothetical protein
MRLQIVLCFAAVAGFCPASTALSPPINDVPSRATAIRRCTQGPLSGDTEQACNDLDPGRISGLADCRAPGRDVVYRMDLRALDEVGLTYVQPSGDAVAYVLADPIGPESQCLCWGDLGRSGEAENLSFVAPRDGTYFLVLDAKEKNAGGPWDLYYSIQSATHMVGACSLPNGHCVQATQSECVGMGGSAWLADMDCTPARASGPETAEMTWGQVKRLYH